MNNSTNMSNPSTTDVLLDAIVTLIKSHDYSVVELADLYSVFAAAKAHTPDSGMAHKIDHVFWEALHEDEHDISFSAEVFLILARSQDAAIRFEAAMSADAVIGRGHASVEESVWRHLAFDEDVLVRNRMRVTLLDYLNEREVYSEEVRPLLKVIAQGLFDEIESDHPHALVYKLS